MAISSLLVPGVSIPKNDTSWLTGIFDSLGGAIDQYKENKAFNGLADRLGAPSGAAGTQMASLPASQPAAQTVAGAAPLTGVERGAPQGDTYQPFIDTVKGRVTNPYGLAAVAATGRAESGWSGANANRSWSDPSQSGQPGTAGGVMSWRAERLANLQKFAASKGEQGNGSPQTQAEFFLNEDPQLIDRLNQAKSPTEAADIIAGSWKFAGYDQQGGEAARRRALAQNYYANEFSGMPMEQGDGGFDSGRFGTGAPPVQGREALAAAMTEQPYVDPMVSAQPNQSMPTSGAPVSTGQPVQTASSAGNLIAAGVTPVQRGGVDPATIQYMLRSPQLREAGLKLWAANAGKADTAEPWQFVTLPDGTLARANQQTGEVMSLGQFAKSASQDLPSSYREYQLAKQDGFKGGYADWEKVKQPGVTVNTGDTTGSGDFYKEADKLRAKATVDQSNAGFDAQRRLVQVDQLDGLLKTFETGGLAEAKRIAGEWGINTENLNDIQAATALINQMVPAQRPPGSGTMSDADLALFKQSLPRIIGQPGGNALIVSTMREIATYDMKMAEIADQVLNRRISPEEGSKQQRALANPLSGFREKASGFRGTPDQGKAARPTTEADFNALPSGALYVDPDDGQTYRKR